MTSSSIPKQRKLIDLQKQKEVNEQMKMKISKLKKNWIWPRWRETKRRGLEATVTTGMKAISQILTRGSVARMEWKTVPSIIHRRRH
jgi:septation ring formation regulator EzrA